MKKPLDFFSAYPRITRKLQTLYDVGLGYISVWDSPRPRSPAARLSA